MLSERQQRVHRHIRTAMQEAIRVMLTYEATDTDRQLAVRDLEIAIQEHDTAAKRRQEATHG
jgi:hypothetical protein